MNLNTFLPLAIAVAPCTAASIIWGEKKQNGTFGFLWRAALAQLLECQCIRELAILGFLLALEFCPTSGEVVEALPFPLSRLQ